MLMEKAIELLHDSCFHDLPEEDILLLQLLATEVLPVTCGPLVIVEQVDKGCIGRFGEQLLIDVSEEPGGNGGKPVKRT